MTNKLAVIVLDGMTFSVLDVLFKNGCMPYLKSLSDSGTNLQVQSDIPLTSSAWVAMISGKKPFESGFSDARSINYNYQVCRRSLATKTVWHHLNEAGKSVGLFNAPYVYPVYKLDGFLVTGKGSTRKNRDFTYPYSAKGEILKIWGGFDDYETEINKSKYRSNVPGLIKRVKNINNNNAASSRLLIGKYDPDVFIGFYTETDKLLHVVYDDLMRIGTNVGNYESELISLFNNIDSNIKKIFDSLGKCVEKIIVSDHGFGKLEYRFKLEQWLVDNGFLEIKDDEIYSRKKEAKFKLIVNKLVPNLFINYYLRLFHNDNYNDKGYTEVNAEGSPPIIWNSSLAFAITGNSIYINDIRFRDGIIKNKKAYLELRNQIVKKLLELKLPDGRPPFPNIVVKPDNYCFNADGPDIVIMGDIVSCERPNYDTVFNKDADYFTETKKGDVGSHRRNGIFIGHGANFTKLNSRKVFDHTDLPSLILNLVGVASHGFPKSLVQYLKNFV